jgi:DNA-binding transcriptional regulator YhcF (GntR family)
MMAPGTAIAHGIVGTEVVRARLLTSLHVGRLEPGDRVPSVRRLAELTGLNRKTIHKAYTTLAREGLLDVRPGSGTFVAGRGGRNGTGASSHDLVSVIARMRATAAALQLEPAVFASFVQAALGDGLAGTRVAVVECNREQAGMIETDLARRLGVTPFSVLLARLRVEGGLALRNAQAVVTTACHLDEVAERCASTELGVHPVSLDSSFPRRMIELSRGGRVLLVVHDPGFGPAFFRLLRQLGLDEDGLKRFAVVPAAEGPEALRAAPRGLHAWLSPLVRDSLRFPVPRHVHLVSESWHVPAKAMERLSAELALDQACRRALRPAAPVVGNG